MSFKVSPGVYVNEVDLTLTAKGDSDFIAGIVVDAPKGLTGRVVDITTQKQFIDMFGKPTPDRPSMYSALAYLEEGVNLKVVRVVSSDAVVASCVDVVDSSGNMVFAVKANSAGEWGNNLNVAIEESDPVENTFKMVISHDKDGVLETFVVSMEQLKKDGYGRSMYVEDVVNNRSRYVIVDNINATAGIPVDMTTKSLNGGSNGSPITNGEVITALKLLEVPEEHELSVLIQGGWEGTAVQNEMIRIAESRRDTVAILSFPRSVIDSATAITDMVDYVKTTLNPNSSYAAIYGGYVKIYDAFNDKVLMMEPTGHVAAVFARAARVAQPWTAPAGVGVGVLRVLGVSHIFSEGQRDQLYKARINPIQSFAGQGIQIYGQKTLTSIPSALDRLNVRMLGIAIAKTCQRTLRNVLFKSNDRFQRANVKAMLDRYMEGVKRRGGVVDYVVVVDETNNTGQDIDENVLNVDIYIKPTRTIEFIKVQLVYTPTGVSFELVTGGQ